VPSKEEERSMNRWGSRKSDDHLPALPLQKGKKGKTRTGWRGRNYVETEAKGSLLQTELSQPTKMERDVPRRSARSDP